MVAAAAIHAAKKRKAKEAAKRDALKKQLEADKAEAALFFDEVDTAKTGTVSSDSLEQLLKRATGAETVSEDGLSMVLTHLGRKQGAEAPYTNLQLPRADVLEAIGKYRYFLTHSKKIERIFDEFDANKNGVLEKGELKKAMQSIEDREHTGKHARVVFGVETRIRVTEEDVDYIMELCDTSGDGAIDRAEALPALARWDSLANIKVEEQKSCPCIIS
jgi:Ca2+-binding EF-hand superfamily protein